MQGAMGKKRDQKGSWWLSVVDIECNDSGKCRPVLDVVYPGPPNEDEPDQPVKPVRRRLVVDMRDVVTYVFNHEKVRYTGSRNCLVATRRGCNELAG